MTVCLTVASPFCHAVSILSSPSRRRVRFQKDSPMVSALREAGYHVEACVQSDNLMVVSFPCFAGKDIKLQADVSISQQFALAAFMQRYWADNQVSCTISFDPETETKEIEPCLNFYQYQLKGVSLLPRQDLEMYPQLPYEPIDEATFSEMRGKLRPISWSAQEA